MPVHPSAENRRSQAGAVTWAREGPLPRLQRMAAWIAQHELWLVGAAAPFLLFPSRWTLPAFFVIVVIWLCRWVAKGTLTISTPADVPIVLIVLMASAGFFTSVDAASSLAGLWRILLGVAVFYGLVNAVRGEAQLRWLPPIVIGSSLALAVISLIGTQWDAVRLFRLPQVYEHLPTLIRDIEDQNAFNPRIMGMALATLFPVPLALLLFGRSQRYRVLAGITVLVMGVTLLLTQSLQGAVGVGCALLFMGACWNRWILVCVPLLLGVVLLGLGVYGPQQAANALLSLDHPLGIAAVLRLDMWSRALAMIRDMPYTGIGLDTFPVIQTNFYTGLLLGPEPHAHNLFLQIALDVGIPGLFAFLWIALGLGYAAFKAYPRCEDPDLRALLLGGVGGAVSYVASGFLDTIWTAKPSVLMWFVLGFVATLSLAAGRSDKQRTSGRLPAFVRRCSPLLLLLLLLYPGLFITRGGLDLNLAAVRAHKLLLSAQAGEGPPRQALSSVADDLRRVLLLEGDNPDVYDLLGRVLGWLGDYEPAIEALRMEAELDAENAIARYAPFESLRRRVAGEEGYDRWEDTIRVYKPRMNRFPERAEGYVLIALVRDQSQENPRGAAAVLKSGIDKGAEPQGLLLYYSNQLSERAE
jgi:putative inorganic carbon (HCO3(-)) transporter